MPKGATTAPVIIEGQSYPAEARPSLSESRRALLSSTPHGKHHEVIALDGVIEMVMRSGHQDPKNGNSGVVLFVDDAQGWRRKDPFDGRIEFVIEEIR
jgi:hypothetical protein